MGFLSSLFGGSKLTVDGATAVQMVKDGAQLVDVRQKHERKGGYALHDTHIPLSDVSTNATKRLSDKRPVIAYCASGMRSRSAAKTLRGLGFEAYSLKGGFSTWTNAGGRSA